MPSILADLVVNLIGDDSALLAAAKRSSTALEATAAAATKANATMAGSSAAAAASAGSAWETGLQKVASAGKYAAVALVAIGGYSVDAAAKFQAAMELVHTQAGMSQSDVDALSKSVLALAPAVGIGPDKLAEGLYHVASAFGSQGMPLNEMMDILTMAAHNAATGMADMEDSTQAMIGVLAAGLPDVHNASDAAAYLNTTVGIGDMRMQQLSAAIATGVLPTFKEAGLGMTDFSAALATLTDNVTPANQSATRLRMTIALLGAPSKAAFEALKAVGVGAEEANNAFSHRDELQKYGVNVSQLSADLQKPDGLLVAVNDLKSHLQNAGLTANEQAAVIERAFGGGRTSAAIQTLLDESDRLASKYKSLGTEASRASTQQEDWAKTQATFKQQANELGSALQVMGIQLGEKLLPALSKFVQFLTTHQAAMKAFFAVVIIGLTLMTAAWIAMGVAALANPVGLIVLAIVAAIVALSIAIYELVTHWKTVWGFIKAIALDVWHWLVDAWHATWNAIMAVINWIDANIIKPLLVMFHAMADTFTTIWHGLVVVVNWIVTNIFKPIADFAWNFMLIPLRLIIDLIVMAFKVQWAIISTIVMDFWNNVVKPVARFISEAFHVMVAEFKADFDFWVGVLRYVYDFMVFIWHGIYNNFIGPLWEGIRVLVYNQLDGAWNELKGALNVLSSVWGSVWGAVSGAVKSAWSVVSGIINSIVGAIHTAEGAFKSFENALNSFNPSKIGSGIAHMFGFAEGGIVPGPKGKPLVAVVHGGEYVLNTDQVDAIQGANVTAMMPPSSGAVATVSGVGGGGGLGQVTVNVDGKKLFDIMVARAQRNKGRNSTATGTFLK